MEETGRALSKIDPDTIYERLRTLGHAHSEAKAAFNRLSRLEKPYLAKLVLAALKVHGVSVAHAEKIALASDDYAQFINSMAEAERAKDESLVDYDTAKTWVELARSANANERERLRVLGMVG